MAASLGAGLGALLWRFSKDQLQAFVEAVSKGEIVKSPHIYLKTIVDEFTYESSGRIGHQSHHEYVERLEWSLRDQLAYFDRLTKSSDYLAAVGDIASSAGCDEHHVAEALRGYLVSLLETPDLVDQELADHVGVLVNDLRQGPVERTLQCFVDGLWIEDNDSYRIHNSLQIRRTRSEDFESEVSTDLLPLSGPGRLELPSAVIELRHLRGTPADAREELQFVLRSLRLFRLGSVCELKTDSRSRSYLATDGSTTSAFMGVNHSYVMSKETAKKFADFLSRVRPLFRIDTTQPARRDPVWIALDRYQHALIARENLESRITSAITTLEALFLKASERQELSHRLAQRSAILMRPFGHSALGTYRLLMRAYSIRSAFIHGARSSTDAADLHTLLERVLECARFSIVAMGDLLSTRKKDDFLTKLDESLLESAEDTAVRGLVISSAASYLG